MVCMMDVIEAQQKLLTTAVSTAFEEWQSQLRTKIEECRALRKELEMRSQDLQVLRKRCSGSHDLQRENQRLRGEVKSFKRLDISEEHQQSYQDLQRERDALMEDNGLKQTLIETLQNIVRLEKKKNKNWLLHSRSTPSSPITARASSPNAWAHIDQPNVGISVRKEVLALSNQEALQKQVSRLKGGYATGVPAIDIVGTNASRTLQSSIIHDDVSRSVGSELQPGPRCALLDFDGEYSNRHSSPDLPPPLSPQPLITQALHKYIEPPADVRDSNTVLPAAFTSDSTEPPSQSAPRAEQLESSSCDTPEIVEARSVDRKAARRVGDAEDPVNIKSEPSESRRIPPVPDPNAQSSVNESLEVNRSEFSFVSLKKDRDPRRTNWRAPGSALQIAVDETFATDIGAAQAERHYVRKRSSSDLSFYAGPSKPLQEIKNQQRSLPSTSSTPPSKKPKSNIGRGAAAISSIAEDGEDHSRKRKSSPARDKVQSPPRSNTSAYRRLENLLAEPSPAKQPLARPSSRTTNLMDGHLYNAAISVADLDKDKLHAMRSTRDKGWKWYEAAESLLQSVGMPCPKKSSGTPDTSPRNPSGSHNQTRTLLPSKRRLAAGPDEEESFRSRPLHRLSLNDFKINPACNAGVDYAYTDVIRSRDQRKCLPGCTRECCRKKFRAIAEALPKLPNNGKQFLDSDPLDASSQERDDEILADFLGPNSEVKVRSLTPLARENLLLEAKTKIAADKYGKMHRFAHDRAKSPPGFWRTVMPGTQEEEDDRREARKREWEEVETRYKEACREGGRWIFADE